MWSFLKSTSPESSLRVNMFLVTGSVSMILFSVSFFIAYRTFSPIEVTVRGHEQITYRYESLDWLALGTFVAAIVGSLYSIWYGKKINKLAETAADKPDATAQQQS